MIEEILLGLATNGSGLLPLGEQQLLDIAAGNTPLASSLYDMIGQQIDTTAPGRPYAYLVYSVFDARMNLVEESSGVLQVQGPGEIKNLDALDIQMGRGGYLHTYLTNPGRKKVAFDNFKVQRLRGKTREMFDYYPCGLDIHGLHATENLYKWRYTGKELQTGEWADPNSRRSGDGFGLNLHDYSQACLFFKGAHEIASLSFGSRYYQATTGRWHVPDPAGQFQNPYLGMGNNPVVYVDLDGASVGAAAVIIGAVVGAYMGGASANSSYDPREWDYSDNLTLGYMFSGAVIGAASAGAGGAVATSGMPLANTASIAAGSLSNSLGTHFYTTGQTDISVGLGAASYNFTDNNWGYLGKKDNSTSENIAYGTSIAQT